MILYDISMTIKADMAVYKNRAEKKPVLKVTRDFSSSAVYETRLEMDLHTGTHLDMPLHLFPEGGSSDQWPVENIFSRCAVLDFSSLNKDCIAEKELEQKEAEFKAGSKVIGPGRTVLLKTVNSQREDFDLNFIYLEKSGAKYLSEKNIAGVGIDALGIERSQPDHDTHRYLLKAGVWILEGLRLSEVPQGFYILLVVPIKIQGVEALPARAFLLSPDSFDLTGKE